MLFFLNDFLGEYTSLHTQEILTYDIIYIIFLRDA